MMMMMMMILMILIKGAGRGILQNHCSKPSHNIIHCRCIWSYLIRNTQNYIGRSKSITKLNSWLIDKPQFWREREGLEVPVRPDFFPNGPHQSEIFHHQKCCHEEILSERINLVMMFNISHLGKVFIFKYVNAMAKIRMNHQHLNAIVRRQYCEPPTFHVFLLLSFIVCIRFDLDIEIQPLTDWTLVFTF